MTSVISIENLSKRYFINRSVGGNSETLRDVLGRFPKSLFSKKQSRLKTEELWALKDVSLEITKSERVGILGRNGSGKSTLLKILSRITEPTEGKITLRGKVASLLEVGTGFHPELTGRENIFLNGTILGMPKAEILKKFDQIIDFAEVEAFLDVPVKRYSSGMYVRLAFAIAAHIEPEILIVDEVLAVGDLEFQKKCIGKMEEVSNADGRTVLFVSHNLPLVQSLCKTSFLLNKGVLCANGCTNDVINTYLTEVIGGTSENAGVFSFTNHDNVIQIKRLEIINHKNVSGNTLALGMPMTLNLTVSGLSKVNSPQVNVSFYNAGGVNLGSVSSAYEKTPIVKSVDDEQVISISIESMPFNTGTVFLSTSIVDGTTNATLVAHDKDVFFSVEDIDFGIRDEDSHGLFLLKSQWKNV